MKLLRLHLALVLVVIAGQSGYCQLQLINHNTHDFEGTTPALGLVVSANGELVVPTRGFRILKFDEDLNYAGVFFEDNTNFVNGSTRWHSFENNPNFPNSFVGLLESGGYTNRIFAFDSTGVILEEVNATFGQSFGNDVEVIQGGDYFFAGGKNCCGQGGGWDARVSRYGEQDWDYVYCSICGTGNGLGDEMASEIIQTESLGIVVLASRNEGGSGSYAPMSSPFLSLFSSSGELLHQYDGRAEGEYGWLLRGFESQESILVVGMNSNAEGSLEIPTVKSLNLDFELQWEFQLAELPGGVFSDIQQVNQNELLAYGQSAEHLFFAKLAIENGELLDTLIVSSPSQLTNKSLRREHGALLRIVGNEALATYSTGDWDSAGVGLMRISLGPIADCTDISSCNYNPQAEVDNGTCDYSCCPGPGCCDVGMHWDWELGMCQITNVADTNLDGCVQLNDLLDLLSAYGNCAADESVWQCGEQLEYHGYDYETVLIGERCWFAENLKKLDAVYPGTSQSYDDPRSYVYGYNGENVNEAMLQANYDEFGVLYNYAAVQSEDLCPAGWTPGTDEDWNNLAVALGVDSTEAYTLSLIHI